MGPPEGNNVNVVLEGSSSSSCYSSNTYDNDFVEDHGSIEKRLLYDDVTANDVDGNKDDNIDDSVDIDNNVDNKVDIVNIDSKTTISVDVSTGGNGDGSEKQQYDEQAEEVEEEGEVEPKLKYERIVNDIQKMLKTDYISCVAFHSKIVCIGTGLGYVRLFDHLGNSVPNKHLRTHMVAVNQISIDDRGEYLVSCSDDGAAYLYGLLTAENSQETCTQRSIKSVAIDPEYYKLGSNRRFITGDTRLTLYEKTFLSRTKSTVLCESFGCYIRNIRWKGQYVLWTCSIGVRVYDLVNMKPCAFFRWPCNERVIPLEYPCCMYWKDNSTFLIGWVNLVMLCKIEKRMSVIRENADCAITYAKGELSIYISGIAPLGDDQVVVLGYPKMKDTNGKSQRPIMCFLRLNPPRYMEVTDERLSLRDYADFSYRDLHMECLSGETLLLIACPKDAIIASIRNADDRIDWLMAHDKYEDAMRMALTEGPYLGRNSLLTVGRKYVDYLLDRREFRKAAELCARVLKDDKQMWEEAFFKFAGKHQLRAISRYLPSDPSSNKLNPRIYEMVLYEYLKMEPDVFLEVVKKWPVDLYNVQAIINAVLEHIVKDTALRPILLESLAVLYTHAGQYDKASPIYLQLRHKDIFRIVGRYCLPIADIIRELMDLDTNQTLTLLLGKDHRTAPDVVVAKLEHNKYHLYLYLDALDRDEKAGIGCKRYHGSLVKLYAHFAPQKLLPLLKRSDNYPIQSALSICQENHLYPEMVYLLGRIGNTKEALQLVINQIGDMEQAIGFCKEHNDVELWEELIGHSLTRPDFITYLLRKIGSNVDPRMLIRRINDKMNIPGLKDSLVKMMQDYNLQVSVQEGCKNIIESDYYKLHAKLVGMRQSGICIDDEYCCNMCHQKVLIKSSDQKNNVLIFNCHHSFHEECLPSKNEKCIICYSEKPPISTFP